MDSVGKRLCIPNPVSPYSNVRLAWSTYLPAKKRTVMERRFKPSYPTHDDFMKHDHNSYQILMGKKNVESQPVKVTVIYRWILCMLN